MDSTITISRQELAGILQENVDLQKQVTELQTRMTEMVSARRPGALTAQVREFMMMTKQEVKTSPEIPSEDIVRLRAAIITEEYLELMESLFDFTSTDRFEQAKDKLYDIIRGGYPAEVHVRLDDFVDACGDLDYVVEGSRLAFGVDGVPIAAEIHRANMAKLGGKLDAFGKFHKPAGWQPPNIVGTLQQQGWAG